MKQMNDKNICCGCGACVQICPANAIVFIENGEGFSYPQILEERCMNCGKCRDICPIGRKERGKLPKSLYALKHKKDIVRRKSASGGAFSALSDVFLRKNGKIYGVVYDDNLQAKFVCAESWEERNKMRDSKYVQADIGDTYLQIRNDLCSGLKDILFVGTPCQVAGLYRYLKQQNVSEKRLMTVDLVCHGVASPKLFSDYIEYCQRLRKKKIVKYYHRKKFKPWGIWSEGLCYDDHTVESGSALTQIWKKIFISDYALRPSCYSCQFASLERIGDISIGDFWNGEREIKEFQDTLGVSLVSVNSDKGEMLFEEIVECDVKQCRIKPYQKSLRFPTKQPKERDTFWKEYEKHGFPYLAKKYGEYNLKNIFIYNMGEKNGN